MNPRTALEKKVTALSEKIDDELTDAQVGWGCYHLFDHIALMRRRTDKEFTCMECGKSFGITETGVSELDAVVNESVVTCPHCGHELKVKVSPRWRNRRKQISSMQILQSVKGLQLVRTIHFVQWTCPGDPAEYEYFEVVRRFFIPNDVPFLDAKEIVLARSRIAHNLYSDVFIPHTPITLKYDDACYDFGPKGVYPRITVIPQLKRAGWCKKLLGPYDDWELSPNCVIRRLLNYTQYETIAKAKRWDIWFHVGQALEPRLIAGIWPQIKMLIRHNYKVKDFGLWYDTVNVTRRLGLDILSPKYILPDNLKQMHDMLFKREQRAIEKKEKEERRAKIRANKSWEETYKAVFGKLLDFELVAGDIDIRPLQNYDEFCEEGDAMHHCVETYWKRKQSYILSIKSKGKRLATAELSMNDFHIVQCRGYDNEKPKRYNEICGLLRAHQADFMRLKPQQLQRKKGVRHESV